MTRSGAAPGSAAGEAPVPPPARSTARSQALFERARELMPGGVNSPVRAFGSVGGTPRFVARGEGAWIWDVDGNRYVDYVLSWGPLILGHAHPRVVAALEDSIARGISFGAPTELENELAELVVDLVPSVEMVRLVNSGTEAVMSALRLARAFTGRERIIKCAGCYHGHADSLLVQAGSGVATLGLPDSPGVPAATTASTVTVPYNDLDAMHEAFAASPGEIAAVIVEPIAANMGFVLPRDGYLAGVQALCREHGALFVLDEVMTGFRASLHGAQGLWGLEPDLTTLGKVLGGGLPVGAYGGRREIMERIAPAGPVYQAGTLSGNPLATTSGLVTLRTLREGDTFQRIAATAAELADGLSALAGDAGVPVAVGQVGAMLGLTFLREPGAPIADYAAMKRFADTDRYARFFHAMLDGGVALAPSQFEAAFVSAAHGAEHVQVTLDAAADALRRL